MATPNEPPPSYEQITGSTQPGHSGSLNATEAGNGISPQRRRSMEDERRPLPEGWVRQFDQQSRHQFFVDARSEPPRSIWHHPYDDEQFLATLSTEERERLTQLHHNVAEYSDEETSSSEKKLTPGGAGGNVAGPSTPAGPSSGVSTQQTHGLHKYGRRFKDRITGSTHEEREKQREIRAQEEQQAYTEHMAFREAMARAIQTGQPQLLAKDRDGHDVYLEPPDGPALPRGARGYNPYSSGVYANPNARFVRPPNIYNRPQYGYGYRGGYRGGYGLPIAGGLVGGALLGGLLF